MSIKGDGFIYIRVCMCACARVFLYVFARLLVYKCDKSACVDLYTSVCVCSKNENRGHLFFDRHYYVFGIGVTRKIDYDKLQYDFDRALLPQ